MSQSQEHDGISGESTPKMPRREALDDSEDPLAHHPLPHLLSLGSGGPKTPTSVPLLFLNQSAAVAEQQQQQLMKQRQEEHRLKERQQEQKKQNQMQQDDKLGGLSGSMPPSPVQPVLTPIPHELTVNAQQELREFFSSLCIYFL